MKYVIFAILFLIIVTTCVCIKEKFVGVGDKDVGDTNAVGDNNIEDELKKIQGTTNDAFFKNGDRFSFARGYPHPNKSFFVTTFSKNDIGSVTNHPDIESAAKHIRKMIYE